MFRRSIDCDTGAFEQMVSGSGAIQAAALRPVYELKYWEWQ
jgi:hypothetical protein